MKKFKLILAAVFSCVTVFFTGCSSEIRIKVLGDGKLNCSVDVDLGKTFADTFSAITSGIVQISGGDSSASPSVFDEKGLTDSMTAAGFSDVSASVVSATQYKLGGVIEASDPKLKGHVYVTPNSLAVVLSPSAIQKYVAGLSEEQKSYLDLFMAPVFNGEKMDEVEYVDLISAIYGPALARDLSQGRIKLVLVSPDGKKVIHYISVMELLLLEKTKTYTARW